VAVDSIKLWNYRYMMCPKCKHFSLFRLSGKGVKRIKL
jgi:DNA-directed RNA polymerase subunit RPC12/RpoP